MVCVDECHVLSFTAWQCLLKSVEEPPRYGYWIFCTTKTDNIPETLMDRCACYRFRLVPTEFIVPLLLRVHHNERLHLERDALRHIADVAKGSPRRALTFLEECRHLTTLQEVQRLLALKR